MNELLKVFKKERMNEWVSGVIPGLLLHMCLGMVYCWSLIKVNISNYILGDTSWAFSIQIAVLAFTAIIAAPWIERRLKDAARYGAVLFFVGLVGAGLSCLLDSLLGLYVFYGIVLGVGSGLIYRVPLNILSRWFRSGSKRGLVGNIFMLLSACSSFIMVPLIDSLNTEFGVVTMFLVVGMICLAIQMLAGYLLEDPENYTPATKRKHHYLNCWKIALGYFHQLPGFILLWTIFFINLSCSIAVLSCERDLMMVSGFAVVLGITLSRVVNPIGKGMFASIEKKLGKGNAYRIWWIIFGFNLLGIILAFISRELMWIGVLMISATYGASFAIQPGLLADFYGRKVITRAYPVLLTAWAFAGFFGNRLAINVFNSDGGFYGLLFLLGLMYILGIILSIIQKWVYDLGNKK